jgi:tRNA threonylcarbamoyladenosine biosynthesis protein TsaE
MDDQLFQIFYSLTDIDKAVKEFWAIAQKYNLLAFSGEMGAGKTTFIHRLCEYLHVTDTVTSPTFALINEYHFNDAHQQERIIYHLDWYRLRDSAEAVNAGMEDCMEQAKKGSAYCFVEWPEKAIELLQTPYLWISILTKGPLEREIKVELVVKA